MSWTITPALKHPAAAVTDPDARTYLLAVEQADGQFLESGVATAINTFVTGCKADGIWTAIKASCILAGARTLNGALVPLVGAAPTNFNFVSADYNRKTGLKGNGSNKYLSSGASALATGSATLGHHVTTYCTETNGNVNFRAYAQSDNFSTTTSLGHRATSEGSLAFSSSNIAGKNNIPGFMGSSSTPGDAIAWRAGDGSSGTYGSSLTGLSATNYNIFARANTLGQYGNSRLAFYSIGESLNLALLDARVTDLINAFGAAIPS
jgi:hypothetical protein